MALGALLSAAAPTVLGAIGGSTGGASGGASESATFGDQTISTGSKAGLFENPHLRNKAEKTQTLMVGFVAVFALFVLVGMRK